MLIGYARVSTKDQSLEPQIDALKKAGCERIFSDTTCGAKAERPGLKNATRFAREQDTLLVYKLDRLGRSLSHLIKTVEDLGKRGVGFRSLSDPIDTTTASGKLIFGIFGALAEFELALIRERTNAGLAAARARGRKGGRRPVLKPSQVEAMKTLYESRKYSVGEICDQMKICRKTFYNYLQR